MSEPSWVALGPAGINPPPPTTPGDDGKWLKAQGGAMVWEALPAVPGETLPATIIDAKGDLIAGSAADTPARLPVGTSSFALIADPTQATGMRWADLGAQGYVGAGAIDAKGDLLAGYANDDIRRFGVGANGTILTADSAAAPGMKWGAAPSSGMVLAATVDVTAANTDLPWTAGAASGAMYTNYPTGGGSLRTMGAPSYGGGARLIFRNYASNPVTILHYTAGTGARFVTSTGLNVVLTQDDTVEFVFDSSNWVEVARNVAKVQQIPVQLNTPRTTTLGGNAFWSVTALANADVGRWEFVKDVDGAAAGIVQIPKALASFSGRIVLHTGSNVASGSSRMEVSTAIAGPSQVWTPALTVETAQDIPVGGAYWPQATTFPLTPALVPGSFLIVNVKHLGTHVNDTLAVNTLVWAVVLEVDVP